jgi:hypothetical protein
MTLGWCEAGFRSAAMACDTQRAAGVRAAKVLPPPIEHAGFVGIERVSLPTPY